MAEIFKNDTFAVVDLETTGTQKENHHHIIQFGCAIIKNLKVVKTYSYMINPHRDIPLAVQNLTGIHEADVRGKKDFSYFAPKIIKILQGTIFVAHNVNFDLPFLNYELVQHGYEALTNKAIDTVELAKIAFPTLPSYKLSDLTARLKIKHNPHKANSDAYATAILLIKIISRLKLLPQATMNTLSSLSSGLIRDTSWIFTSLADYYRQQKRPLAKEYMQVRNIILQKQDQTIGHSKATAQQFPQNNQVIKKLLKGHLHYRKAQIDLIHHLHAFILDSNQRAMMVEAPNGTGKTFSYLFSYAYQLYSGQKLVIATSTKVLQEQLIKHEIPQLLAITHLDLMAETVKASSHYIDLDGFVRSLFEGTQNKPTLVLQMQILVWLTKTKTGDLDELNLTNYKAPLFAEIAHPGDARVGSRFASVDFWNLARQKQEEADILVTNHAYLSNHYMDTIWGQNPYLVIDEAHRFKEIVSESRNDSLQFESLWGVLSHLLNLLFNADDSIQNTFTDNNDLNFLLNKLQPHILELIDQINEIQKFLYSHKELAVSENTLPNGKLQLIFQGKQLFQNKVDFQKVFTTFERKLDHVRQETNQVLFKLDQEQANFLSNEESLLDELTGQIDELDYYSEKSYQLSDIVFNQTNDTDVGFILSLSNPEDPLSTNILWLNLDASKELQQIYHRFNHLLFISATLTVNGDFNFAIKELALEKLKPITYIGKSTFNISRHLKVLSVTDMPDPDSPNFLNKLEYIICNDLDNQNHVLVLMTNLETISQLFSHIVDNPALKDFEILAQGVTGSNERIAKRFTIAKKAIILGADSFWEGIDFHNCQIDLVMAVKLPFEAPDQPEVRLRQKRLTDLNLNVFENDTLPRAVVRFRQGMGRLIRGEEDSGQFVILDSRLWTKDYGQAFLKAIPVKTNRVKIKELKTKINNYDQRRHKTNN